MAVQTHIPPRGVDPSKRPPPAAAAGDGNGSTSGVDALREAMQRVAELRSYFAYFATAQLDRLKLTVRNMIVLIALGVVALLAAGAVIITAVVLLIGGIAQGIGQWLEMPWLGNLLTGAAVLLILTAGISFGITRLTRASRLASAKKYEAQKRQQQVNYGHDVAERAGTDANRG
jgi:hypothetical protein